MSNKRNQNQAILNIITPKPLPNQIVLSKQYKTRNGCRVIGLDIKLKNSCGEMVTYPVKGTIILREKPRKTEYMIWSINGVVDVVWGNHSEHDLVEEK
jgi:hypothetical protein